MAPKTTGEGRYPGALTTQVLIPTERMNEVLQDEGHHFMTTVTRNVYRSTKICI